MIHQWLSVTPHLDIILYDEAGVLLQLVQLVSSPAIARSCMYSADVLIWEKSWPLIQSVSVRLVM